MFCSANILCNSVADGGGGGEERVGDIVPGAGSVWVDAATGDSASLLFIKREMTGSSQPGDFAISGSILEEKF